MDRTGTETDGAPGDRLARRAPWLMLGYMAALAALRLWLSPFLEVDEAQLVGQTDLRMVYGHSHPPLYNWLTAAALRLTGDWAGASALVRYGLTAAFHLLIWDAARRLGGPRAGLRALAVSAFLPQIVWMAAVTHSNTTLAMAGMAGMLHALTLIYLGGAVRGAVRGGGGGAAFLWLGFAAAMAMGAKFNAGIAIIGMLAGGAMVAETRARLFTRRLWLGLATFLALAAPQLVAAALDLERSAGRIEKLYRDSALPDLPGIGLDGALSFAIAALAWTWPLLLVWGAARWRGEAAPGPGRDIAGPAMRAVGWGMAISMLALLVIVLVADMHVVRERYLSPLLAALPVWVALRWRFAARWPFALAGIAYLAVLPGMAAMTLFGGHEWGRPYDALARALPPALIAGAPVLLGDRPATAANFAIAAARQGVAAEARQRSDIARIDPARPVLLLWRGPGAAPSRSVAALEARGWRAVGAPARISAPATVYGKDFRYSALRFAPPGSRPDSPSGASSGPAPGPAAR